MTRALVAAVLLFASSFGCEAAVGLADEASTLAGKPKQFLPKANGNEGRAGSNTPRHYLVHSHSDIAPPASATTAAGGSNSPVLQAKEALAKGAGNMKSKMASKIAIVKESLPDVGRKYKDLFKAILEGFRP
eukprot:CAMPEP_0204523840 /NCGR_PEP_ID=MMETSP0661-20131031/7059_1 /ASSEMBLY_ACC=CAM_ASM_000606 /TAXON_ID=109239 /ORGANISM="Alexandrium margalefi, Strain AMGDE01CS-322" /LENGTH=131 /DNA_ID=CAMNT_0051529561 /DNA_START=98 /DNA_END=493 /DNA_ORIENTATION=-